MDSLHVRPSTAPLRLGSHCVVTVCEEPLPFRFGDAMTCAVPHGLQLAMTYPGPYCFLGHTNVVCQIGNGVPVFVVDHFGFQEYLDKEECEDSG
jgi:hypothetical protein